MKTDIHQQGLRDAARRENSIKKRTKLAPLPRSTSRSKQMNKKHVYQTNHQHDNQLASKQKIRDPKLVGSINKARNNKSKKLATRTYRYRNMLAGTDSLASPYCRCTRHKHKKNAERKENQLIILSLFNNAKGEKSRNPKSRRAARPIQCLWGSYRIVVQRRFQTLPSCQFGSTILRSTSRKKHMVQRASQVRLVAPLSFHYASTTTKWK